MEQFLFVLSFNVAPYLKLNIFLYLISERFELTRFDFGLATSIFYFLRMFLLVINIRNLRINLRNEILYLCIFMKYMMGFISSSIPRSLH